MAAWCYPVLNGARGHQYSVQAGTGFLDPGYFKARHMQHTGCDFNATTGGDSDLNDPVFCISEGLVQDVGFYHGWGWVVLVFHPSGMVWSQYAHLKIVDKKVKPGVSLECGQPLGTIGKGDKHQFWAHLHFEIRKKSLSASAWPSDTMKPPMAAEFIRLHYVDPLKFLAKVKAFKRFEDLD
jgi:murein DD-endopeptidase MepM/ murein hydrolase activator NlpD